MTRNNRHVVPTDDGRWAVRGENADRASGVFDTKRQGQDHGREILGGSGGGELVIHGLDGRIQDSDTVPPGHDPFPPRDKK